MLNNKRKCVIHEIINISSTSDALVGGWKGGGGGCNPEGTL